MKLVKYGVILLFVFAMDLSVFAELYQYINEEGVQTFTDDLSKVSVAQREQLKIIDEIRSEPVGDSDSGSESNLLSKQTNELSSIKEIKASLIQEKEELKQTYELIMGENKKLSLLRKTLESKKYIPKSELNDFNGQVSTMNLKIQQYESRLQLYKERSTAYNIKFQELKRLEDKNIADE